MLVDVNDRFLADLDALPSGPGANHAMAGATADSTRRDEVLAELELGMLGSRHARLRPELDRWNAGLHLAAAKLTDDAVAVDALVATLNGYCWQATTSTEYTVERLEAVLTLITRRSAGG